MSVDIIRPDLQQAELQASPVPSSTRQEIETSSLVTPTGKLIETTKTTTVRGELQDFLLTQGISPLHEAPDPNSIFIPYSTEYLGQDILDLQYSRAAQQRVRNAAIIAAAIDIYQQVPDEDTQMFVDEVGNPWAQVSKPIIDNSYQGLNAISLLLRSAHTGIGLTHPTEYRQGYDFILTQRTKIENMLSTKAPIEIRNNYYYIRDGEKVLEASTNETRLDRKNNSLNSTIKKVHDAYKEKLNNKNSEEL